MTDVLNRIGDLAELLEPTDPNDKIEEDKLDTEAKLDGEVPSEKTENIPPAKADGEEEVKPAEGEVKPDVEDEADPPPADAGLLTLAEQNKELRQVLRAQKKDLTIMKSKLDRLEKKSTEITADNEGDNLFGEKETVAPKVEELSEFEKVQNEIMQVSSSKNDVLTTLVEVMELTPTYADIRSVCSQSNFNDVFDAVGEAVAQKEGKDANIAALEAELAVWKMPNPYKYMYGLIKKYHPSYATVEPESKSTDTVPAAVPGKTAKELIPAKAPASLATVPGTTEPSNAWTAERIDAMPEDQLDTVPKDIYEKYLAGDLDK
jgi:hypothetical protein